MTTERIPDPREIATELTNKLAHLEAWLVMTHGEASESFNSMNDSLRDNYLWGCTEQLVECRTLAQTLSEYVHARGANHG